MYTTRAGPQRTSRRPAAFVAVGEGLGPGPEARMAVEPLEEGDSPDEEVPARQAQSSIVKVRCQRIGRANRPAEDCGDLPDSEAGRNREFVRGPNARWPDVNRYSFFGPRQIQNPWEPRKM